VTATLKISSRRRSRSRVSARKISAVRRRDFRCSRRAIPPLNALKRDRETLAEVERTLTSALLADDETRRQIRALAGQAGHPTSVWADCDQTWDHTKLVPYELPAWRDLSERMKIFLGFDLAMELGWCFAFTANLSQAYLNKWVSKGSALVPNINQRLRRELRKIGIPDLPHCYVVEARTRSGKSRCKPHLHGVAICDNPIKATRFKVALETALVGDLKRPGRQRAIRLERGYTCFNLGVAGRSRWVEYMTKNAHFYDERLGLRRVHVSHSYVALARKAWAIRTDEFALDASIMPNRFSRDV
jgi:hypothetical protein